MCLVYNITMINDYRIVKIGDTYAVNLVTYNTDLNPVSREPVKLESDSLDDITSILIYTMSSLTKPILDAEVFEPMNINETHVQTALNMMRNNNDS